MTRVEVTGDRILLFTDFKHKDHCKAINGARWNGELKHWYYPANATTARDISLAFSGGLQHDGPFRALLNQAHQAERARTFKSLDKLPEPWSKTPSWLHQRQAFHFLASLPQGGMAAMEMGCGKSKVAVDLATHRKAMKILITCPLSVLPVWPREFERHSARPVMVKALSARTVHARCQEATEWLALAEARGDPAAVVVNHEALWRNPFAHFVQTTDFDLLVVDEAHRAKAPKGKLSKFLWLGTQRIDYKLALTGTPMPHSPMDIFAQYRFLDEGIFGRSFWKFRDKFAVMGGWENKQVVGYQNHDELQDRFNRLAYRITKDEALDLPPEIFETRYCAMPDAVRPVYDEVEKNFYTEVDEGTVTAANALVKLLRLQQITSGYVRDDDGVTRHIHNAKRLTLKDLLENDIKPPVVCFARFTHDLMMITDVCDELGLKCGEVSGARKDITDTGTFPPDFDCLAVQIQAGGLGVDFTAASTAIYVSMGFNLAEYLQCLGRLHRHGQHHPVTHIHLVVEDTVDQRVYDALSARQNVIEAILSGAKP